MRAACWQGRAKARPYTRTHCARVQIAFRARSAPRLPLQWRVRQRNYYEHIIRRGADLDVIRRYIFENPARRDHDRNNPQAKLPQRRNPAEARLSGLV